MLFEVIAERWDYRPRRCTVISYKRGDRGALPDAIVKAAEKSGLVKIIESASNG